MAGHDDRDSDGSEDEQLRGEETQARPDPCPEPRLEEEPKAKPGERYDHRDLWGNAPSRLIEDTYGYNRIPAFWFTLNLPFNYLYEIQRFQQATLEINNARLAPEELEDVDAGDVDCLDPMSEEAME